MRAESGEMRVESGEIPVLNLLVYPSTPRKNNLQFAIG